MQMMNLTDEELLVLAVWVYERSVSTENHRDLIPNLPYMAVARDQENFMRPGKSPGEALTEAIVRNTKRTPLCPPDPQDVRFHSLGCMCRAMEIAVRFSMAKEKLEAQSQGNGKRPHVA
jgi:hypothetical protein